jgi:hypothetical protein
MNESDLNPDPAKPDDPIHGEYQDPHYHDEDEIIELNDLEGEDWHRSTPPKKKPGRRLPPPRRHYLDD